MKDLTSIIFFFFSFVFYPSFSILLNIIQSLTADARIYIRISNVFCARITTQPIINAVWFTKIYRKDISIYYGRKK